MTISRLESAADSLEPYRIYSVREIVAVLGEIRRQRQLVRMTFSEGRENVLTSILAIDIDSNFMYIDSAPDPAQNRRITLSQQVSFETMLDKIRILFSSAHAERCEHDGFPALRFPLPESLARIQRRQAYRVTVPFNSPIRCTFLPPGTDLRPLTAPAVVDLLNISTGGIAVVDTGHQIDSRAGAIYPTCQIGFPGYPVSVSIEVRHAQVITLPSGKIARHIGCRFMDTPTQVTALVQRYIMKLEREQNARNMGAR